MTEVTSVVVRMTHIRQARLCASGARAWWRKHDFDWSDFLTNGILADRLLATGDPYATRVVDLAKAESNGRT